MATIYLRNVSDDVVDKLQRLAVEAGMSLNAFAGRELRAVAQRADNAALMGALPNLHVDVVGVLASLDEARTAR